MRPLYTYPAGFRQESNLYGVILLLQMSIGLTRSIVESCKVG